MKVMQLMGVMRGSFPFILILLLTAAVSSGGWEETEEDFLSKILNPASGFLDEDTAELLWISCRLELLYLKGEVQDLNLHFLQETFGSTGEINSKFKLLARENILKLISFHQPQLKQTLLRCLRNNNLPLPVSGEESGSFPSRNFGRELLRRILAATNQPPAAALSPGPSPSPAPTPLITHVRQSPVTAVAPSPKHQYIQDVDENGQSPPDGKSSAQPTAGSDVKADNGHSTNTIIIAVVVTASVTFFAAALLFLCCCRISGVGAGQNDERPLLSLSMSDYSVGSSNYAFGNSIKEDKLGHQSFSHNCNNHHTSSLDGNFPNGAELFGKFPNGQEATPPLKPPPGRVVSTLSGPSPPKLPGRPDPLPPEPPSFKVSNTNPLPPPPAPPPPVRPSGVGGPPPPGPPPPPPKTGARPPPPPKSGGPPPRPPTGIGSKMTRPPPGGPKSSIVAPNEETSLDGDGDAPKTKLKPFFWDKVQANPDQSMVWSQIKAGSFQFNEEMIETLFGYNATDKNKGERKKQPSSLDQAPQFVQIIDPKKSQNLSILLKALNVTIEEVCDALTEGNELPVEFLQTLLKMAPTSEEELKLRLFNGELSQLGPADRFLKALVNIPFAFKRMEALHYMCSLEEEVTATKESLVILEDACKELKSSRLFLKLLEAVLKTGNRMNDGTYRGGAQAFKLDTLLKLSDVKGIDGKTTLLHFVVQEIIRTEGARALRVARESRSFSSIKSEDLLEEASQETEEQYHSVGLQVVSRLSSELENVKKAAVLDADTLTGTVARLGNGLIKTKDFLNTEMKSLEEESGFHEALKSFVPSTEADVMKLLEEENRIMALVKSTGDYFHGNAGKDEGLRLFVIVREFLTMLDKVCKEINLAPKKRPPQKQEAPREPTSSDLRPPPSPDIRQRLFPAITDRRMET